MAIGVVLSIVVALTFFLGNVFAIRGGPETIGSSFSTSLRLVPNGPNQRQSPDSPPTFMDLQTKSSSHGFKMEGGFGRSLRLVPSGPNQQHSPDSPPALMESQST